MQAAFLHLREAGGQAHRFWARARMLNERQYGKGNSRMPCCDHTLLTFVIASLKFSSCRQPSRFIAMAQL